MPQLKGQERWNYVKEHEEAGLNQKDIAQRLGLTHGTLRKWLSQNREKYSLSSMILDLNEPLAIKEYSSMQEAYEEQDKHFMKWLADRMSEYDYWKVIPQEFKSLCYVLDSSTCGPDWPKGFTGIDTQVLFQYMARFCRPIYGYDYEIDYDKSVSGFPCDTVLWIRYVVQDKKIYAMPSDPEEEVA